MVKETEKLIEQINEFMELACKQMSFQEIKDLSPEDLRRIKLVSEMLETAKNISMEQAKTMERIDLLEKKLDLLLESN